MLRIANATSPFIYRYMHACRHGSLGVQVFRPVFTCARDVRREGRNFGSFMPLQRPSRKCSECLLFLVFQKHVTFLGEAEKLRGKRLVRRKTQMCVGCAVAISRECSFLEVVRGVCMYTTWSRVRVLLSARHPPSAELALLSFLVWTDLSSSSSVFLLRSFLVFPTRRKRRGVISVAGACMSP